MDVLPRGGLLSAVRLSVGVMVLFVLGASRPVAADVRVSSTFRIAVDGVSAGGGFVSSGAFRMLASIAPLAVSGRASSGSFNVTPGFPLNLDTDGDGDPDVTDTDDDGDGMPDAFELTHGLDPLNAADASQDADGDGLTNLEEFQRGRNPRLNEAAVILPAIMNTLE